MIYSVSGSTLNSVNGINGNTLSTAYDVDGEVVFPALPTDLKVMTYNVGQWYIGSGTNVPADKDAEYYALQNGMIANADADILFLCEYWDTFSQAGRTALSMLSQYYPYIETRNGGSGYYGRAICSKYPLSNYTHHAFSNESSRYYDSVSVTIGGTSLKLVVTHLSTDASKRSVQIGELITFLSSQDMFICAGDFNPLTICNGVTTEADDYTNIIMPLLNAGFHLANCSTRFMYTYNDDTWNGCLDNIVTSSNITIEDAYVDETKLTDGIGDKVDHMPLIAELQIS